LRYPSGSLPLSLRRWLIVYCYCIMILRCFFDVYLDEKFLYEYCFFEWFTFHIISAARRLGLRGSWKLSRCALRCTTRLTLSMVVIPRLNAVVYLLRCFFDILLLQPRSRNGTHLRLTVALIRWG
jgi:hypothetical protein